MDTIFNKLKNSFDKAIEWHHFLLKQTKSQILKSPVEGSMAVLGDTFLLLIKILENAQIRVKENLDRLESSMANSQNYLEFINKTNLTLLDQGTLDMLKMQIKSNENFQEILYKNFQYRKELYDSITQEFAQGFLDISDDTTSNKTISKIFETLGGLLKSFLPFDVGTIIDTVIIWKKEKPSFENADELLERIENYKNTMLYFRYFIMAFSMGLDRENLGIAEKS